MQRKLFAKLGIIVLLSIILLIPLAMIEAQIAARSERQDEVVEDIAASAAGAQTLVGPVLSVRYRERVTLRQRDAAGKETVQREIVERVLVLPPAVLGIDGDASVETRQRGLYRANLFHLAAHLQGHFEVPPRLGLDEGRELVDARAALVLGLGDSRGVGNDPEVKVNGRAHRFTPGGGGALDGAALQVDLGALALDGQRLEFAFPLALTGSSRLAIAPAGDATTVTLRSPWPHPSFQGRFLPLSRSVSARGFEAQWQVSHLARSFDRVLATAAGEDRGRPEALVVGFIEPVNVYLKAERAVKYGVLFVVLTFAAFFLTEVLRRLPIHPLQYLLVGLALAVFFLLLVALSEHLAFGLAYALSAAACVALIGSYLAGALGSARRGAAYGGGIAALYGVLYGVLLSEDNALLMGALLLFAALAASMLATRRIDWYRLGATAAGEAA